MAEEDIVAAPSAAEANIPSENKRKFEDLNGYEASEPNASGHAPAEPSEETKELPVGTKSVEESTSKEEEVALETSDDRETKRPRLEKEIDDFGVDHGQQVEKVDHGQQVEKAGGSALQVSEPSLIEDINQSAIGDFGKNNLDADVVQQTASEVAQQDHNAVNNAQLELPEAHKPTLQDVDHSLTEGVHQSVNVDFGKNNPDAEIVQQTASEISQEDSARPTLSEVTQQSDLPISNTQQSASEDIQQANLPPEEAKIDLQPMSLKIQVPNNKVGALIGKAGDTIRYLQHNSGARIQITRDSEADPFSSTRSVELIGSLEDINKAEKLIKDVIAEADAGGSPALVARGFGAVQTGAEQMEMQVPYEKVGLIIGKGGETIKNLQTKSGARIQVILQNIPEGDASNERIVRITGSKNQIEAARALIKDITSQNPSRTSHLSGGFSQKTNRHRRTAAPPQWGPRFPASTQPTAYPYQQGNTFPSQHSQYPPQAYGGYNQLPTPRGGFNNGWDQRPPVQGHQQSGTYDHYNQGGLATGGPAPVSHMPTSSVATPNSTHAPANGPPAAVNYNYGQPQGYGQPVTYSQSSQPQQSYGHENSAPANQAYGGYGNSQPSSYAQQGSSDTGYLQQHYNKPTYGVPSQGPVAPHLYGQQPRASQPGDFPYQGAYGTQMPYPYPSNGPTQQPYPYGPTPASSDGYVQPSSTAVPPSGYAPQAVPVAPPQAQQGVQVAPVYAQQGGQVDPVYAQQGGQVDPVYAQQTGQPAPAYPQQGGAVSGYVQYPSSQAGYVDQSTLSSSNNGYQGPINASYNSMPSQAYGAQPASAQVGYVQPAANQQSYEQPVPQAGYAGHPGAAPVAYGV